MPECVEEDCCAVCGAEDHRKATCTDPNPYHWWISEQSHEQLLGIIYALMNCPLAREWFIATLVAKGVTDEEGNLLGRYAADASRADSEDNLDRGEHCDHCCPYMAEGNVADRGAATTATGNSVEGIAADAVAYNSVANSEKDATTASQQ